LKRQGRFADPILLAESAFELWWSAGMLYYNQLPAIVICHTF
jgi:hypothetical protein